MSPQGTRDKKPSPAARAEAAAWIARLHGPNRTQDVEAGLRRWLDDDPEHVAAFEFLTETWEKSARLRRRPTERIQTWERAGFGVSFSRAALATAATAVLAVIGTLLYLHSDAVSTGVGELRTLMLDDGSRVQLNTNTRIVVHYEKALRRVYLDKGEALFEVARHPEWPFVVTAQGREIRALGTEFLVKSDPQHLVVTLVEGKVAVTPAGLERASTSVPTPAAPRPRANRAAGSTDHEDTFTLAPGERLTFVGAGSTRIDRPSLNRITAWEHGQVALDNTPLAEAAAEMNRYSRVRILIEDPAIAAIQVSGLFRAGDSGNFAKAVARTYHLRAIEADRQIRLEAEPLPP
jgi:transmembrane sensor